MHPDFQEHLHYSSETMKARFDRLDALRATLSLKIVRIAKISIELNPKIEECIFCDFYGHVGLFTIRVGKSKRNYNTYVKEVELNLRAGRDSSLYGFESSVESLKKEIENCENTIEYFKTLNKIKR